MKLFWRVVFFGICIIFLVQLFFRIYWTNEMKKSVVNEINFDFDMYKVDYFKTNAISLKSTCTNNQECFIFLLHLKNSSKEESTLKVKYLYSFNYIDSIIFYQNNSINVLKSSLKVDSVISSEVAPSYKK